MTKIIDICSLMLCSLLDRYQPLKTEVAGSSEILVSIYVEIKCQLDATEVFIADLIACSTCFGHHYAHHASKPPSCKPDT